MSTTAPATNTQIEYAKKFLNVQYGMPMSSPIPIPNNNVIRKEEQFLVNSDDDEDNYTTIKSIIRDKLPISDVRSFYKDTIEDLNNDEE